MIYLFTRDPNSYDKLRDPSKKIYFEYHDAWDTTSVDAWIFILGNIILALAYFANFKEFELPKKVVIVTCMILNVIFHLHILY